MAVRNINEVKPKKKKWHRLDIALTVFFIVSIVIALGLFLENQEKVKTVNDEYNEITIECETLQEENEKIRKILEDPDHREYFIKIARDNGYCLPGEKVYYNSSFGE